ASSMTNHSSGPSQSAMRPSFAAEVFGLAGSLMPSALESAATEAAGARSEMRSAGGSTASLAPFASKVSSANAASRLAAPFDFKAALAIEALSLLVEEHHAAHFDLDHPIRHWHVKRPAHALAPAGDQRQRDRAAAILRPIARRHVADHLHGDGLLGIL